MVAGGECGSNSGPGRSVSAPPVPTTSDALGAGIAETLTFPQCFCVFTTDGKPALSRPLLGSPVTGQQIPDWVFVCLCFRLYLKRIREGFSQ
jgi:hypothetical protein